MSSNCSNQAFVSEPENIQSLDAEASKQLFSDLAKSKPTLEMALRSAGIQNIDIVLSDAMAYAAIAKENKEIASLGLTDDEAGAIACYTLQVQGSKSPYSVINECLSMNRNSVNINSLKGLLYLLLSGLRKLPRFRPSAGQQFYRGIMRKVPQTQEEANGCQYYAKGRTVTWWSFTSTVTDLDTVNTFMEKVPESTLFTIGGEDLWGYSIKAFSQFPKEEEEILLEPEAKVFVTSVVTRGSFSIVNVTLQKFEHLVLEDIIPVGPALQPKQVVVEKPVEGVRVTPKGFIMGNDLIRGLEISWPPVPREGVMYQVDMVNAGSAEAVSKVIYKGPKTSCFVVIPNMDAEIMFKVKSVFLAAPGESFEKIEPPRIEAAVNAIKESINNADVCNKNLKILTELTINGKSY